MCLSGFSTWQYLEVTLYRTLTCKAAQLRWSPEKTLKNPNGVPQRVLKCSPTDHCASDSGHFTLHYATMHIISGTIWTTLPWLLFLTNTTCSKHLTSCPQSLFHNVRDSPAGQTLQIFVVKMSDLHGLSNRTVRTYQTNRCHSTFKNSTPTSREETGQFWTYVGETTAPG